MYMAGLHGHRRHICMCCMDVCGKVIWDINSYAWVQHGEMARWHMSKLSNNGNIVSFTLIYIAFLSARKVFGHIQSVKIIVILNLAGYMLTFSGIASIYLKYIL